MSTTTETAATTVHGGSDGVAALANPVLQEALGVTATGTCLRHPNCPVMVASKIMSCRVCFSEEKSVGTQQHKSFAAVIQQVQRNANAAVLLAANSGSNSSNSIGISFDVDATDALATTATDSSDTNDSTAMSSTEVDVLQQPHALESLMKRLAQVQNWMLRQKEKEVTSLQLQIQHLEQRLSDAENTVQEQSQTVRALRRTIQQDLKIIKTMAMQKEQLDAAVFRFAESQVEEVEGGGGGGGGGGEKAGEAGEEAVEREAKKEEGTAAPEAPKDEESGNYGSPARRTLGRSRAPMSRGNMARAKSTPLSAMALSLQGSGGDGSNSSDRSVSPRKRSILETPSPDHKKMGLQDKLANMKRSGRRPGAADKDKDSDTSNNNNAPKPSAARGPPNRRGLGRTLSSDGLDFSMPIPENSGHEPDAFFGGTKFAESNRASSYWNDNDVSTAHNPSKLFASFRGGLLDIPKSPPQARHDSNNKLKQKPKLTFDTSMMDALRLPSMRGMGGESGPSTVESIPKKKMGANPMGLLTAKLQALPLAPEDNSVEGGSSPELTPKAAAVVGLLAATTTTPQGSSSNLLPPPLLSSDDGNDAVDSIAPDAAKQADDGTAATDSTLYSVTKVESVDNYGDPGIYTGTILAAGGLPHGKGTMTYDSGRLFDGNWSSGQWNGKGKLLNPNGDVYEGDFIMDARHGKGLYKWDNGDVYVGDFSQDERHGRGKFSFHNGNVYDGEFCDGMFDGYGQYDFTDGHYEGEWKEGRYDGQGKLTYSTGGMYTGDFKNSVAHGFGIEVTPDGNERKGVWDNGQPVDFER
jgi:hypothetical protein